MLDVVEQPVPVLWRGSTPASSPSNWAQKHCLRLCVGVAILFCLATVSLSVAQDRVARLLLARAAPAYRPGPPPPIFFPPPFSSDLDVSQGVPKPN